MMNKLDNYALRALCIKQKWFTCGSNAQYDRFFELARNGASIEELTNIIYVCSDEIPQAYIRETLRQANLTPICLAHLRDALIKAEFGEEETEIIVQAIERGKGETYITIE